MFQNMRVVVLLCVLVCGKNFLFAEEGDSSYQFKGHHFLASYCDCDREALADNAALSEAMHRAVRECGATVLDSCEYSFSPQGMTMVFLLSESHASIHTYPEWGACFVDLFTCGDHCSAEKFNEVLRDYLKPKSGFDRMLIRDAGISEKVAG